MDFKTADLIMMDANRKAGPKPSPWYYMMDGRLVKKRKPCLEGDYVHLHRWEGCYRVHKADLYGFNVRKGGRLVRLDWNQFRCLKGMGEERIRRRQEQNDAVLSLLKLSMLVLEKGMRKNEKGKTKK